MLHSGGPAVIQTLVRGRGHGQTETDGEVTSGLWLALWSVGLSVSLVADGTEQVSCAVLDRMARGSEGLNHFRLANDDPQNYPETG